MIKRTVKIINSLGLHARPCTMLVKTSTRFRSDFKLRKDDITVNGKSIMGVMTLAAEMGSELELIVDGVDEESLLLEILELFQSKFGEE
ncbi:MAG: HPr family phosphocarrier protein [Candidatus Cloacimonetes bacterium]|nr:HPr family phosphocarrier protein [Candidatus Cloacimonadota bacterium]